MRKKKANPQIVAAAIIEKDGCILIGRRKRGKRHAGNWEFPGGTLEEGETHAQCLTRELEEELAITVQVSDLLCSSEYSYGPDWTIRVVAYRTTLIAGDLALHDHDEIRWVRPADLDSYLREPVSRPIIASLTGGG